jgi:CubicO group peptidase (beta-lactamase class C family)
VAGTAVDVAQVMARVGLLHPPVAVVMACASPATGVLAWVTGDLPGGGALTTGTPMYAASVTKQVVAVLAAQQVVAAHLDPDAPITTCCPSFRPGHGRSRFAT